MSSPTVAHATLMTGLLVLAAMKFELILGDIKTAFLNADPLGPEQEAAYCTLPRDGIPGISQQALLKVLKPFYGFNDAPEAWRRKLDSVLRQLGFTPCTVDP